MKRVNLNVLLFCIAVCFMAGAIGSIFTAEAIPTWYAALNKPFFSPPNFVFGPVWSTLYVLMGVSLYIVVTKKPAPKHKHEQYLGIKLFIVQLALNVLWSVVFFGIRNPLLAYIEIIALIAMIFLTAYSFYSVSRRAAFLLVPYFLWTCFASVLNLFIVTLN